MSCGCQGARLALAMGAGQEVAGMLADALRENAKLRAEVDRLAKENGDQCDTIFELQQMNERGRTDL